MQIGMSKRKGNKRQMSLTQSLFRRKVANCESTNNKSIINIIKGSDSTIVNSHDDQNINETNTRRSSSSSQPDPNEFDDSFDLFLPRKLQQKSTSSQSSFFEVKKKSRYFDESGELKVPKVIKDDDFELALAISLQESQGTSVSLKPTKAGAVPQLRGKLKQVCKQSLLLRRTAQERERIVTEKVAIVLMEGKKQESINPLPALCTGGCEQLPLYSDHLRRQVNELKTLWTLSQSDLAGVKIKKYFIELLLHYGGAERKNCPQPITNEEKNFDENNEIGSLQHGSSSEDIFGDSCDDSDQNPSPKRVRWSNQSCEAVDEIGSADSVTNISGDKSGEEQLSLTVDSMDVLSLEISEDSDSSKTVADYNPEVELPHAGHELPFNQNLENYHRAVTPSNSKPYKALVSEENPPLMLRHYHKLSLDMQSLPGSGFSRVLEVTKENRKFFVHHCVFKARCPLLLEELERNCGCLDECTSDVCDALFGYIYGANMDKSLSLSISEKEQLIQCCKKFNLSLLAEELENCRTEGNGEDSVLHAEMVIPFSTSNQPSTPLGCRGLVSENSNSAKKLRSSPKETKVKLNFKVVNESDKESNEVITVDTDTCCSVHEVVSSDSQSSKCAMTVDEELDFYLKDGMRLSEKLQSSSSIDAPCGGKESPVRINRGSPLKNSASQPKKSIDKYFQDSFPSLDDIGVAFTPPPASRRDLEQSEEPTPGTSKSGGIVDCVTPGGQLIVSDRATPLPDYESMVSPELQAALQKYGIRRGIGKRKAVTLLRYIYDQIHPPDNHPAVAKAISDVHTSRKQPSTLITESDNDAHSLSSDSSEDLQMFEDLGDVASSQPIISDNARASLLRDVGDFIKNNKLLYAAILQYEPIWLNKFHKSIKEQGIKCNKKELIEVLDELVNHKNESMPHFKVFNAENNGDTTTSGWLLTTGLLQGITFRTEQTEKQQKRKGTKPRTRRKT